MGSMTGFKQVSFYVDPELVDRIGHAAKTLNEPIYKFVNTALSDAFKQRLTKEQRDAIEALVHHEEKPDGAKRKADRSRKRR